MTYQTAKSILDAQERNLRTLNNMRFIYLGFEYRLTYKGGFGAYLAIDRRRVGTRNFKYFPGLSLAHCRDYDDAAELLHAHLHKYAKLEA